MIVLSLLSQTYMSPRSPYLEDTRPKAVDVSPRSAGWDYFFRLSPFGIGHFIDNRYIVGSLSGATQVFFIYNWKKESDLASEEILARDFYVNSNCVATDQKPLSANQKQDCLDFEAESDLYVETHLQKSRQNLLFFGIVYTISAIECIWNSPAFETPVKKKRPKKSHPFASQFSLTLTPLLEPVAIWRLPF